MLRQWARLCGLDDFGEKGVRVGVVGGKLQGVEATYLAHKAGWEVVVIDQDPNPPAKGLCDLFYQCDVTEQRAFSEKCKGIQLLIPALENKTALSFLDQFARVQGIPLAYDPSAYAISSSKIKSDKLFSELGLPVPLPWPEAKFPVIVKPSGASGGKGVRRINALEDFRSSPAFKSPTDWVIQEFLEGPSFSLEVLGHRQGYQMLQVTDLKMDARFDCKRVLGPTVLQEREIKSFEETTLTIARALNLRGIMDVEVIQHEGQLKLLEIDARLPSQTPTVVYLSSGINMVELLGDVYCVNIDPVTAKGSTFRGVVYEHIKVSEGRLEVCGEHIMTEGGPLSLRQDFFGADEAISNYEPGRPHWVATLMIVRDTRQKAWAKRCEVIDRIRRTFSIHTYLDPSPGGPPEDG